MPEVYARVPVKVEYSISEAEQSLKPIVESTWHWGASFSVPPFSLIVQLSASNATGDENESFPWIIAGVGIGLAAYIVLNQPPPQYVTGNDDIEDFAGKTSFWGSKRRIFGTGRGLAGKLKEGLGRVAGDDRLADEGVTDQIVGGVQETAGKAAHMVGDVIHDLNR